MKTKTKRSGKANPKSTYWRNRADILWSKLIARIWKGRCAFCGEPGRDAHHLISRRIVSIRHDPQNGIYLCPSHHRLNPYLSAHGGPVAFTEWLRGDHPEIHAWVVKTRPIIGKKPNYKEIHDSLQEQLSRAEHTDNLPVVRVQWPAADELEKGQ